MNENLKIAMEQLGKEVVKELLSICDIFILPTKQDPNPLSPIEASFMKKPLVISNFAGNCQELIVLNKNGLILNEINAVCIKEALFLNPNRGKIMKNIPTNLAKVVLN